MKEPIPDGALIIQFREPLHRDAMPESPLQVPDADVYQLKWEFRDMDHWRYDENFMFIIHPANEGRTVFPFNAIQSYDVRRNSKRYSEEMKEYQRQHGHTWIPIQDMLGNDVHNQFFCGQSKTGERGCGASMMEGEIICNG